MDNQKLNLILDKLLEKTEQGNLRWETTADKNTFLVVLSDSSISIRQDINHKSPLQEFLNKWSYTFDFRNEVGDVVESVNTSKLNENELRKAQKIFDLARSQSSEADKTVDRILEEPAA